MRSIPIALAIAGSDSGGGAGLQADLKTFAALDVHGASVLACLTAQNPARVLGALPVDADFVRLQLEAVFSELPPRAIKTGMLFSKEIIETVSRFLKSLPSRKRPPLVIDPVIVSTSGAILLEASAIAAMKELFSLATIITPNLDEAEQLLELKLKSPEDLRAAARQLHKRFGCAALVKGGHLPKMTVAIDFFFDGQQELLLRAPFVRGVQTHGTGCTYSAAIAAGLAKGQGLPKAVVAAKKFITKAINNSVGIARHQALGWS